MTRKQKQAKTREFFVSGVIQIRVRAASAAQAVVIAQQRAATFEKSPTIVVGLDNISTDDGAAIALDDAAQFDAAQLDDHE